MKRITSIAIALLAMSCGENSVSKLDEAWNQQNDPQLMGFDEFKQKYQYVTKFSELPLEANLSEQPWSGDYWATYRGGITYRWNESDKPWQELSEEEMEPLYSYELNIKSKEDLEGIDLEKLSPAEKFDIYNNDFNFTLTNYERSRTRIMKTVEGSDQFDPDFEIPSWEGLCHAWAPATLQYKAPKAVTVKKNKDGIAVPFGASDIKALLTYNIHINQAGAKTKFLGQRCNLNVDDLAEKLENEEITQEEYRAEYRKVLATSACKDTNAGAFHLTLANQVGKLDEGFIVDVTRDAEVWNQGVYKYATKILEEGEARAKSAKGTVKTVLVETTMYYVNEVDFSWNGEVAAHDNPEGVKEYHYYLELNDKDEIIGGEWVGPETFYEEISYWPGEKDDRPDFMWKMERKGFTGFFAPLKKIYRKSVK